jgi:hypothetical protein
MFLQWNLDKPKIADFSGNCQTKKLLDIADGLRPYDLWLMKSHPDFSPVGLQTLQPITLLQTVCMPAASNWLTRVLTREQQVPRKAIRMMRPETHRQFLPPLQQVRVPLYLGMGLALYCLS